MPPRKTTGKRNTTFANEQPLSTLANGNKTRQRRTTPPATTLTSSPTSTTAPASSSSAAGVGSVYTLKISLLDSHPLIWRRLLVHSSTTLGQLHLLIQLLFDWLECHLHQFALPLPNTSKKNSYRDVMWGQHSRLFCDRACFEYEDDDWSDRQEDEAAFTVGELLPATGDKLLYEYDLGDSWHHLILVEAIEPATEANTKQLPRCAGGRCAAPCEDSGGIGWHREMVHKYKQQIGLVQPTVKAGVKEEQHKDGIKKEAEECKDDEEAADDEDDEEGVEYYNTVDGWIEETQNRLGFVYNPLHFNRARIERTLKHPLTNAASLCEARVQANKRRTVG